MLRSKALTRTLLCATMLSGMAMAAPSALAQEEDDDANTETITVTGTRIQAPNVVATSPVNSIGQQELEFQLTPELEQVFRDLPVTIPGDGANVNNGTAGAATVNLRGLGSGRSLILIDGKRMVPYNYNGLVDIQTLPASMVERIDIVTGGASAVYGSDAMAGAINFILRDDFEGLEVSGSTSITEDADGEVYSLDTLLGTQFDNGAGHVMLGANYTRREGVLLGDRDFGIVGVSSTNGSGLDGSIVPPPAECESPNVVGVSGSGSTTSMPAVLDLVGGSLQFRADGSLGSRCTRFNFNPYNYYQTPQERYSFTTVGNYEINNNFDFYTRATFSATNVRQQVAPSGVFGNVFEIPLMNPFLTDSARQSIIANINGELAADPTLTLVDAGVIDRNSDGVLDMGDSISVPVRRRTLELGTRSEDFDSNIFQIVVGMRGDLFFGDWTYDTSFQYAESDRTTVRGGYTNVANIATALNTISDTECETPDGSVTAGCVPINIFGPFGSITPEAAAYASATALQQQLYDQTIASASMSGSVPLTSPFAENSVLLAFGAEYREENGEFIPDECLKLPPVSCQGGAGGNQLPIAGGFSVYEGFGESIIPLVEGRQFMESLQAELGFRYSEYDPGDGNETWKAGLSWAVNDQLRFRIMKQQAVRAPNVGELASPVTTGLDNALSDPCSSTNAGNIDAELRARCIATGMRDSQVGNVNDIVSGQINVFTGTDPNILPDPETSTSFTLGAVWQPELGGVFSNTSISLDYYDIKIEDYIGTLSGQEALDACYVVGDDAACEGVKRIGGGLSTAGAGVEAFITNLEWRKAEGLELSASTDIDLPDGFGSLNIGLNANYYLANERLSAEFSPVTDCNGFYGSSCDPVPELRFVQRTTWTAGNFDVSLLWRYLGSLDAQPNEASALFEEFRSIDAYSYFDLTARWYMTENVNLSLGVDNLLDEQPPIIGSDTGMTSFNSGNTFPSLYDILGRTYTVAVKANF